MSVNSGILRRDPNVSIGDNNADSFARGVLINKPNQYVFQEDSDATSISRSILDAGDRDSHHVYESQLEDLPGVGVSRSEDDDVGELSEDSGSERSRSSYSDFDEHRLDVYYEPGEIDKYLTDANRDLYYQKYIYWCKKSGIEELPSVSEVEDVWLEKIDLLEFHRKVDPAW